MELSQIRNFIKVVESGKLTQAADELHISQPNLSTSIRLFEKELGVQLFDRSGRRLTLSKYGKILYPYASKALQFLGDGLEELRESTSVRNNEVSVSVLSGTMMLPRLLQTIHQKVPEAHISIIRQALNALPTNWDIALYSSVDKPVGANQVALMHQALCLMVPEDHPLSKASSVTLQDAAGESFITWPDSQMMGRIVRNFFLEARISPKIIIETDDGSLTTSLVHAGVGIAFAPERQNPPEGLHYLPITFPSCHRYIVAQCRTNRKIVRRVFKSITDINARDTIDKF